MNFREFCFVVGSLLLGIGIGMSVDYKSDLIVFLVMMIGFVLQLVGIDYRENKK